MNITVEKNDKTVCTIIKSSFRRYNIFIYGSWMLFFFLQLEIHTLITSFCGDVNFILEKRKKRLQYSQVKLRSIQSFCLCKLLILASSFIS